MAKPRVEIEWPDDLTFADDVTSNIIGEIECWRGRSYHHPHYRSQGVGVAGHCTFVLRNDGGRYSIDDDDDAPIGAKVQVSLQVGASTWRVMWTGYIDSYDYQYRRQGYDRIAVRALGRMAQLETATWTISNADPDPRAYDVINSIVEGVTGEAVESNYNVSGNRNLEPPGGGANEGSRDWSVRLENFHIEEAPALQTIRDAATISFAHVYETAAGKIRIQGLPARQSKIDGGAEMTFRDSSGTGVRVHDYEVSLKTERIANAAARSIVERFEPVDTTSRFFATGDGSKTLDTPVNNPIGGARRDRFRVTLFFPDVPFTTLTSLSNTVYTGVHWPGPTDRIYYQANTPFRRAVWPGGLVLHVHFTPHPYLVQDPDGVLAPTLVTPSPYTETSTLANIYTSGARRELGEENGSWYHPVHPRATDSNSDRVRMRRGRSNDNDTAVGPVGYTGRYAGDYTQLVWDIQNDLDAPSSADYRWELEYRPFETTQTDNVIAQNDTSITRYGRRGYAVPGIFWGPDVNAGSSDLLDIRSFVGYIVRDEFLGKPGYYGTIVVDLTRQFYPTTGATNPELDVGDKITLYQGTTSRDYLVSAIRYRFRQGEQLRAQIECAPARVM